jgi:O-methyltransferase involved in polyketide biosynthesis
MMGNDKLPPSQDVLSRIDTSVPESARIWNYWLGGKDNYPVDRSAGDEYVAVFPGIVDLARAARAFLGRVVRYLAGEAGIRQFLDIGAGLPTVDNVHEVAQRVAPDSRVVYVDNSPSVLAHSRALLTSTPEGVTDYLDADLREPEAILAAAARTLDFDRPVALMLMGMLGHFVDDDEVLSLVGRLVAGLPPGSYLATYDGTHPAVTAPALDEAQEQYNQSGATQYVLRSPKQIARRFDGLVLVEPGVVPVTQWRPDPDPAGKVPAPVDEYGGVGRKP